jgi:hypothetical protein
MVTSNGAMFLTFFSGVTVFLFIAPWRWPFVAEPC